MSRKLGPFPDAKIVSDDETEMLFAKRSKAMTVISTLVARGKSFSVRYEAGDGWLITVDEINERGGLAGKWSDT